MYVYFVYQSIGQDAERGTFAHRHHVVHDQKIDKGTYRYHILCRTLIFGVVNFLMDFPVNLFECLLFYRTGLLNVHVLLYYYALLSRSFCSVLR